MTEARSDETNPIPAHAWPLIAGWLKAADVDCIELTSGGAALRMVRGGDGYQLEAGAVRAAAPTGAAASSLAVTADVAGIFLTRHPSGGGKLPGPGDRVQAGEVVGLLQIGLLLAPVLAPVAGRLGKTLLSPGAQAGYGTRLMEIFGGDS